MTKAMPPSTTAISGTRLWTRKSEVDSPIAVVSALTIQKKAVTSGTFEKAWRPTPRERARVRARRSSWSLRPLIPRLFRRRALRPDEGRDRCNQLRAGGGQRDPDVGAAAGAVG